MLWSFAKLAAVHKLASTHNLKYSSIIKQAETVLDYGNHRCIIALNILFRFSYIVIMLEKILENFGQRQKVYLLYDVACTLSKHLKVKLL